MYVASVIKGESKMSGFTYETETKSTELETYEWDNVWWEQTGKRDTPRVLYIGDSISCGIRRIATERSEGELLFDGFGTSKALDNPFFFDSIRTFAKQQGYRRAVIFNNGLHGWHLDDEEQYPYYYERAVQFLLEEFKDTTVAIILTTSVANAEREKCVIKRNATARKIADKYGLPVIDLYSASVEHSDLRRDDGVHYTSAGYALLADKILEDLRAIAL